MTGDDFLFSVETVEQLPAPEGDLQINISNKQEVLQDDFSE